ncbi:Helix-turn-helix domain-containing protein [Paenimyroides aquimaris]|uniref:Helix-turn-helix domain-containing protein n=1 Tax=Paenimyroides marinum TaxID=1159016 RepID=A0A1H6KIZ8_9FLAO|nr:helix-turn-helix transcriptional regulator [Paenimyroides aquimaris]SEH75226.1 Helix-turn-helix domain-containing protein [Paenimyroides aquimaris]
MEKPIKVKSISEYHQLHGLPAPEHPLISIIDYAKLKRLEGKENISIIFGYYTISLKRGVSKMFYGQQQYDFDEGVLYFMAPNQILRTNNNPDENVKRSGWLLLIHPDFLWNTSLAKKIKHYEFFDYSVNEALFLSEKEEEILNNIIQNIKQEYHMNIDKFSKDIIISQIETLLNYSERFYNRQFITREKANHQVLEHLEKILTDYFNSDDLVSKGLPTVQYIAETLNISPGYLSGLLKVLTGQSTQQHIHDKLIEKAKEKLSTTDLSVSEIAYELGFEHPQSFSKLFKAKTSQSPLEFRESFN